MAVKDGNANKQQAIDERLFNTSLEKAIRILEAFSASSRGMTIQDLTAATGADRSAVQRVVYTLQHLGYLVKDEETKRYVISLKAMDLSFNYLRSERLVERAIPHIANLGEEIDESVHLSRIDGCDIIYLVRWPRGKQKYFASLPGRRRPAFCTSGGRAIISQWPRKQQIEFLQASELNFVTPKTITDISDILEELDKAKAQQYAIVTEECLLGEVAVSAPIFDREGEAIAAIHVTLAKHKWAEQAIIDRIVPPLLSASQGVSELTF